MTNTAERVTDIVADHLGVEKETLKPETHFQNDLGADSLDQVELVMELEEEFDIFIGDDETEDVMTLGQVIAKIEAKLKE